MNRGSRELSGGDFTVNRDSQVFPMGDRTVKSPLFSSVSAGHPPPKSSPASSAAFVDISVDRLPSRRPAVLIEGGYLASMTIGASPASRPASRAGLLRRRTGSFSVRRAATDSEPPVRRPLRA